MRVTVCGASGGVGRYVAEALAWSEHEVRVVTRDADGLPAAVRGRVEVVIGSHLDPVLAAEAARGSDALFWMTPMAVAPDVEAFNAQAAAAAQVAAAGVHRVVDLSGAYCERPGFGLAAQIRTVERALEASATNVTHLRAGLFLSNFLMQLDGLRDGVSAFPIPGDAAAPFVAPRDLASAAVDALLDPSWSGRRALFVRGPDRLSFDRAAEMLSEVLGLEISHREQTDEELASLVTGGWPEPFVAEYATMYRAFGRAFCAGEEPEGEVVVGSTSLRRYADQVLRPALAAAEPVS